jgi:hypothetical protein
MKAGTIASVGTASAGRLGVAGEQPRGQRGRDERAAAEAHDGHAGGQARAGRGTT